MIVIKVEKRELFLKWLEWLSPIIPLKEIDRKVLAGFLSLHYAYRHYNPDILSDILFSDPVKKDFAKRLEISEHQLKKAVENLIEKGLIVENKASGKFNINHILTKYPSDGNFKLIVSFQINEPKSVSVQGTSDSDRNNDESR